MAEVKVFRCVGCGTPLEIPRNSRGQVKCVTCGNDCIIEGLVKNAEVAAKENINSGIPLTATPAALHKQLVSTLSSSPYVPLDVFQNINVILEKRICIPAYCYECSAMAPYSYEAGNQREKQEIGSSWDGRKVKVKNKQVIEWSQAEGNVSFSTVVFCSGNKGLAQQVGEVYRQQDPSNLVDIEELDFPIDVETYSYDIPQTIAFNDLVRPHIENVAQEKAIQKMNGKTHRQLEVGSPHISKEMKRVYLGLYHILYDYNGQEYSMWVTGDGLAGVQPQIPVDEQRRATYEEKKAKTIGEMKSVRRSVFWAIATGVLAVWTGVDWIFAATAIFLFIAYRKNSNNSALTAARKDFEEFDAQRLTAIQNFKNAQRAFNGIYSSVSNDPAAF